MGTGQLSLPALPCDASRRQLVLVSHISHKLLFPRFGSLSLVEGPGPPRQPWGWGLAERQGKLGATRGSWSGESCREEPLGSPLGEPSRELVQEEQSVQRVLKKLLFLICMHSLTQCRFYILKTCSHIPVTKGQYGEKSLAISNLSMP